MLFEDEMPPEYSEEVAKLLNALRNTMDFDEKRKIFDEFAQKYTALECLWRQRIMLEIPPHIHPILREDFEVCLKLRGKALKQFYSPEYLSEYPTKTDELRTLQKMKRFRRCYRLQHAECIWSICPAKFKGPFFILTAKKLEKYLTFPHSQLNRFYRFYQMNAATPLPKDIKEKFEIAQKSYNYMLQISMYPEKWLFWMHANFDEMDFIDNFECKIGEHWFMKEIWGYYINYLINKDRWEVLNVYQRYCRLFVKDEKMRHYYFTTIEKFKAANFDVTKWQIDQCEMGHDFDINYLKCGLQEILIQNSHRICRECFCAKIKKCFSNNVPRDEEAEAEMVQEFLEKATDQEEECILCGNFEDDIITASVEMDQLDNQIEQELADSLKALKATKLIFDPSVTLRFNDSIDPPIPRSIFNYIIDAANHTVLSKLYKTCKYFYIRKEILICNFLYISQTYSETYVKEACFTKFQDLQNPNIQLYCSGISLHLQCDKIPNLASKCLPKLCTCSLKCLVLGSQILTIDEFEMLISGGKIEQAQLRYTEIYKNDETILTIEETLKMLPNVVDLLLRPTSEMYTPETAAKLNKLVRPKKFESFKLSKIPENIDLLLFRDFIEKSLGPKAILGLKVDGDADEEFERTMNLLTAVIVHNWDPIYEAPSLV